MALADCDDLAGFDGGRRRAARSRPRRPRLLFAQGVHPAHPALPRLLPLLHLRAARRARGKPRLSLARRGARHRARRARPPAATRRCSRSATSRSCATTRRATQLARARLRQHASTISPRCAALVLRETGLLPHVNPGVMTRDEIARLRAVSVVAGHRCWRARRERLCERGGAALRLARQASRGAAGDHRGWPAKRRCRSPPAS